MKCDYLRGNSRERKGTGELGKSREREEDRVGGRKSEKAGRRESENGGEREQNS